MEQKEQQYVPEHWEFPKKLYCFSTLQCSSWKEGGEGEWRGQIEREGRGGKKEVCRTAASSPFMIHDREAPTEAQWDAFISGVNACEQRRNDTERSTACRGVSSCDDIDALGYWFQSINRPAVSIIQNAPLPPLPLTVSAIPRREIIAVVSTSISTPHSSSNLLYLNLVPPLAPFPPYLFRDYRVIIFNIFVFIYLFIFIIFFISSFLYFLSIISSIENSFD